MKSLPHVAPRVANTSHAFFTIGPTLSQLRAAAIEMTAAVIAATGKDNAVPSRATMPAAKDTINVANAEPKN